MPGQDFGAFAQKLSRIERDITDRRVLTKIGVAAKRDVAEAVRHDLGDQSMSNWRRGKPIQIGGRFDIVGDGVLVSPERRARGPFRVLEDGRSAGMSRGRKGGKRRRVNGVIVTSTALAPRRVGAMAGRSTWTDAVRLMEKRTPVRFHDETKTVLRRHLTGR